MEAELIDVLSGLVSSVGMWAVFAYLYINEKRAHELTRNRYYDDLRTIAGMSAFSRDICPVSERLKSPALPEE